jgi:phosphoenolpyruvate carboxykinase (ATP)
MILNNLALQTTILEKLGIQNTQIRYQLTPDELHEITIASGQGVETETGA